MVFQGIKKLKTALCKYALYCILILMKISLGYRLDTQNTEPKSTQICVLAVLNVYITCKSYTLELVGLSEQALRKCIVGAIYIQMKPQIRIIRKHR